MKAAVIVCVALAVLAIVSAEPPSSGYGAPSSGYGAPAHHHHHEHHHEEQSSGWGWPQQSSGWGWPQKGWGWPKKYLNLRIPIPQLPKIRVGIRAGIKASIQHPGWGWGK